MLSEPLGRTEERPCPLTTSHSRGLFVPHSSPSPSWIDPSTSIARSVLSNRSPARMQSRCSVMRRRDPSSSFSVRHGASTTFATASSPWVCAPSPSTSDRSTSSIASNRSCEGVTSSPPAGRSPTGQPTSCAGEIRTTCRWCSSATTRTRQWGPITTERVRIACAHWTPELTLAPGPGWICLARLVARQSDERDHEERNDKRDDDAHVEDQQGSRQRSDEHGSDGDEAPARFGAPPPAEGAVRADSGDGHGQHRCGEVRHGQLANTRVLDTRGDAEDDDQRIAKGVLRRFGAPEGENDRRRQKDRLRRHCDRKGAPAVMTESGDHPAAEDRPESEGHQRDERCGDRKTVRARDGE